MKKFLFILLLSLSTILSGCYISSGFGYRDPHPYSTYVIWHYYPECNIYVSNYGHYVYFYRGRWIKTAYLPRTLRVFGHYQRLNYYGAYPHQYHQRTNLPRLNQGFQRTLPQRGERPHISPQRREHENRNINPQGEQNTQRPHNHHQGRHGNHSRR